MSTIAEQPSITDNARPFAPPPAGPMPLRSLILLPGARIYPRPRLRKRKGIWLNIVLGLIAIYAAWLIIIDSGLRWEVDDNEAASAIGAVMWLCAEGVAWIWGGVLAGGTVRQWKLEGRVDELRLTPTRPYVMGQLLVRQSLPGIGALLALAAIGWIGIPIFCDPPPSIFYVLSVALILAQMYVTFHLSAWAMATIRLGSKTGSASWAAHLLAGICLALWFGIALFVCIGVGVAAFEFFEFKEWGDPVIMLLWFSVVLTTHLVYALLKCLVARSWAGHLERAVWTEMG